jgi:hypothetical protein
VKMRISGRVKSPAVDSWEGPLLKGEKWRTPGQIPALSRRNAARAGHPRWYRRFILAGTFLTKTPYLRLTSWIDVCPELIMETDHAYDSPKLAGFFACA